LAYDLVSFDLDGTLVDTACEIAEAANRALESHGIARRPGAEITLLIGAGAHELMRRLLARCFVEEPTLAARVNVDAVLTSMDEHYAHTTGSSAVPYPGCREALTDLKRAGVRLACTTNKELKHARRVLEATRLDSYFDMLIGGDSLLQKKPHASVLLHVAQRLGVGVERSAHLGDSAIDVAAARNAGMAAWAVPYGYNAGLPIEDAAPDRLFASLHDVARHVLAARRDEGRSSRLPYPPPTPDLSAQP
jgi:phosphoglycolate phosphatase